MLNPLCTARARAHTHTHTQVLDRNHRGQPAASALMAQPPREWGLHRKQRSEAERVQNDHGWMDGR